MKTVVVFLLLASTTFAAEMKVHRDLPYAESENERQTLDVYAPTDGKGHPVMVWIHGGGWRRGDKAAVQRKPQAFVDKGFVFVSVNYRFVPQVTVKEMAGDIAKSIKWVHDHAEDYGGSPDTIFVAGHSAGAHLAASVCTDERYLNAEGMSLSEIQGCIPVDTAVYDIPKQVKGRGRLRAQIYTAAFGEDEKDQKELSPITHVGKDKGIPPFLILHVARRPDSTAQSQAFARAIQAADVEAKAVPGENKDHGTINRELGLPDDEPTKVLFEFVKKTLSKDQKAKTDKDVLQGTWAYVSAIRDGKPYKTPIGVRITFTGDNLTRQIGKKTHKHKYKIDPTKKPKQISLIALKDGKEEVSTGIYSLKGDTLKWCFNLPGKPIPNSLESKERDELTLSVLKRVQPEKE